jgi:DNA polymerase III sliding clamp (beta) subunit (PCNA family)
VAKGENNAAMPVLQCVSLKINQNNVHAAACDGIRMMLVKGSAESSGATEFLLPAKPFQIFASIADDAETYDVGAVGNETVFAKDNMLFSIKRQDGTFIDTNQIIQSIKPTYSAVINAGMMRQALELVSVSDAAVPVHILFADDAVHVKCDGETSSSSDQIPARLIAKMPEPGFFYNAGYLLKLFRVLNETVKLEIDEKGMMLIRTKNEVYFQLPLSHKTVKTKAAA